MLRRYVRSLIHHIRTVSDRQRITKAGIVFSLATIVVGLAAFASGNNLLFLLLSAMLATLLIAGLLGRLNIAGLELHLDVEGDVWARQVAAGQLALHNLKRTPSFSLRVTGTANAGLERELYVPLVAGRATLRHSVPICFEKRGLHRQRLLSVASTFPFQFAFRRADVRLGEEVLVYPALRARPAVTEALAALQGAWDRRSASGLEFQRIRPYAGGDPARRIDWRASARTGSLHTREFAQPQLARVELLLDLRCSSEWLELAVEACTYLAVHLHERGAPVRLRTQNFHRRVPEDGSVHDILRYLATVQPLPSRAGSLPDAADEVVLLLAERETVCADRCDVLLDAESLRRPESGAAAGGAARQGGGVDHGHGNDQR